MPCVLNGHPFRLIVDTGAPYTVLDQTMVEAAKIGSSELPAMAAVIGDAGHPIRLANLDRLQIGDYLATNVQMASNDSLRRAITPKGEESAHVPIIGLLGADALAFNGAIIDVGGRALYLKHLSPGGKKP